MVNRNCPIKYYDTFYSHDTIVYAIDYPEELRFFRAAEVDVGRLLFNVSRTFRLEDGRALPTHMYQANNRESVGLAPFVDFVDITTKVSDESRKKDSILIVIYKLDIVGHVFCKRRWFS
jgi:hypothetical protein